MAFRSGGPAQSTAEWYEVGKTAALYGAVGIFHYIFRKQFLTISMNHEAAEATGLNVRLWDFLFYAVGAGDRLQGGRRVAALALSKPPIGAR